MKYVSRAVVSLVVILCIVCSIGAAAQVTHRPVEDFVNAQTSLFFWNDSSNLVFGILVDHGGINTRWLISNCGINLGTIFSGDITEKPLADGRTSVHVVLHGKNVFMRSVLWEDGTPVLGYTRAEVCAGAAAVVGQLLLTVDFINNQPLGGPLPNLGDIISTPGQELQGMLIQATGQGPLRFYFGLPAGTPGFMHVLQRNIYPNGNGAPGKDYWPAEIADVKPLGQ